MGEATGLTDASYDAYGVLKLRLGYTP